MGASSGIGISSSMKLGLSRSAAPVGLAVTGARVRAAGPGAVEAGAARDRPGDVLWSPGFFLRYTTQQVTTMKIKPGVPAPGMRDRMGPTFDERRGVEYRQLRAASLVNRLNARPMPFGWTANPYRGCEMACRYCFARYTHEFLGHNEPEAFERRIYVKLTDPGSLVAELKRARRSGLLVALGTATDPYQPAESKFEVTRRVLEGAVRVPGVRLSITTKSTLVRRDLVLLLRPGTRETFFEFLRAEFPELVPEYERLYAGSAYARRDYVGEVEARVRRLSAEVGFAARRRDDRPVDTPSPRQLTLVW